MKPILVAAALLLAASGVQAGGDSPSAAGAPSVTEMLQRKQDHQLREHLAKEGRSDEIRQMDEENARRLQGQQEKVYMKVNEQLSRSGAEGSVSGKGDACDPESLHMKK